jgi:hypothetical protein
MISLLTAMVLVAIPNLILMLDPSPKALPFHDTRTGTLADWFWRSQSRYDWLVLGNSMANCGVNPSTVADVAFQNGQTLSIFNAACPSFGMAEVAELFCSVLAPHVTQRLIVTLSPEQFQRDAIEPFCNSYGMRYARGELSPLQNWLMKLPLYRYRCQLRDPRYLLYLASTRSLKGDLSRRLGTLGFADGQGRFVTQGYREAAKPPPETAEPSSYTFDFSDDAVEASQRLIATARAQGLRLTMVLMPHRQDTLDGTWSAEAKWDAYFAELKRRFPETELLNLHQAEGLSDEDFTDGFHLSRDGAQKFSRVLASSLLAAPATPLASTRD